MKAVLAYLAFVVVAIALIGVAGAWTYDFLLAAAHSQPARKTFSDADLAFFASDAHVIVGDVPLVLPLIALPDYTGQGPSFSLHKQKDRQQQKQRLEAFRNLAADPQTAPTIPRLSVWVGMYGEDDFGTGIRGVCAKLERQWSKSVCNNARAALRQALPNERFYLVDLPALYGSTEANAGNCVSTSEADKPLTMEPGEAVLLCKARVASSGNTLYYTAIVLIDRNLGALWTVWDGPETASEMAKRQGKAITAFVAFGLGLVEDFASLHEVACTLRRPNSLDAPSGPEC